MSRPFCAAAALLLAVASCVMAASPPEGTATLEAKLIATWHGQGPCTGDFVFRADRTYEQRNHGPGNNNSAGKWALRWDALPPTLVLTCEMSKDKAYLGRHELKIVELTDESIDIRYHPDATSKAEYSRRP